MPAANMPDFRRVFCDSTRQGINLIERPVCWRGIELRDPVDATNDVTESPVGERMPDNAREVFTGT